MPMRHAEYLSHLLQDGPFVLGQIRVAPDFRISHVDDAEQAGLQISTHPAAAIEIAKYDDDGNYRPLKTAPNLCHGWRLDLASAGDLLIALNFLYPAAIGTVLAYEAGHLHPTHLRATLARQTGMYAVVRKITDAEAGEVVSELCEQGCLRRRFWTVTGEEPAPGLPPQPGELPLWCAEACNLFVAAGRKTVKKAG